MSVRGDGVRLSREICDVVQRWLISVYLHYATVSDDCHCMRCTASLGERLNWRASPDKKSGVICKSRGISTIGIVLIVTFLPAFSLFFSSLYTRLRVHSMAMTEAKQRRDMSTAYRIRQRCRYRRQQWSLSAAKPNPTSVNEIDASKSMNNDC